MKKQYTVTISERNALFLEQVSDTLFGKSSKNISGALDIVLNVVLTGDINKIVDMVIDKSIIKKFHDDIGIDGEGEEE